MCDVCAMGNEGTDAMQQGHAGVETLAHSEQLLCSPSVNFFDLNCDGRMINHITH